jgi:hypothetical protein
MVTALSLVYSAAAVRRMVGDRFPVVRVERWWKVCLVVFRGCRPRFMSRQAFLKHFVEWRKAQARALQVTRRFGFPHCFSVRNESKGSVYEVQTYIGGLNCNCEDFQNQIQFFGNACCKHGYAVLGYLGFETLSAYIEQRRE